MAPASPPRRSSRARTNGINHYQQHLLVPPVRGERSTRHSSNSAHPNSAHPNSTIPSSASKSLAPTALQPSESPEGPPNDGYLPRRRKRGQEDEPPRAVGTTLEDEDQDMASDNVQDEDDAVRCICGSEDYPGLPAFNARHTTDAAFYESIELNDDVIGFFLQCDTCKVWQHGACVGIISTEVSPDEYFCEKCRKDLHKIHTDSNGQHYSHYLPTHLPSRHMSTSRATSRSKEGDRSPKDITVHPASQSNININPVKESSGKNTHLAVSNMPSKRRSTMNSRDAAYDEQQLALAIEASKEGLKEPAVPADASNRRAKRSRSGSEEDTANVKRQRTSSVSTSPTTQHPEIAIAREPAEHLGATRNNRRSSSSSSSSSNNNNINHNNNSIHNNDTNPNPNSINDNDNNTNSIGSSNTSNTNNANSANNIFHNTTTTTTTTTNNNNHHNNHNNKRSQAPSSSRRDRNSEEAEAQKAEEEEKAKQRADQSNKRKDRADRRRGEDLEPVEESPSEPTEPETDNSASPVQPPPPDTPSPQKPPVANSHKKVGRSHQKKARGRNQYTKDKDQEREESPVKLATSGGLARTPQGAALPHATTKVNTSEGKHIKKASSTHPHSKVSLHDMKRRAAAYLEFITRTQVEMALEVFPWSRGSESDDGQGSSKSQVRVNANGSPEKTNGATREGADFKDLNSMEMMDVLTRKLVKWQNQFAE